MNATLFNESRLALIEEGIEANRQEAAALVRDRSPEAAERMNTLNRTWFELERAKHQLTGIDPAPYRMRT